MHNRSYAFISFHVYVSVKTTSFYMIVEKYII